MSSSSNTTSFHWKIENFFTKRNAAFNKDIMASDTFTLTTRSTAQFALFFKPKPLTKAYDWSENKYGILLREFGDKQQPIDVDLRIWLEDEKGNKFGEHTVQNKSFKKQGDKCEFCVHKSQEDESILLWNIYDNREALSICCELTNLNVHKESSDDLSQEFRQKFWSVFEQEKYDAIIKVGQKEFKVFKLFFIAHSSVIERMFNSKFKEGLTSTIEIKDISETTMFALIKWLYTEQIEDWDIVEDLFAVSDKYDISVLKKTCVQLMLTNLDSTNAFQRLVLAIKHNEDKLKEASLNCITKLSGLDWAKFTMSDEWINFSGKYTMLAKEVSKLVREKFKV